jgi:methylated-DNA-[protein]-cysteine S-methyltransferase
MATFTEQGLARLEFPDTFRAAPPGAARNKPAERWLDQTARALQRALDGKAPGPLPPLDFGRATPFQKAVWELLRTLAPGQTMTYGQMAAVLGRPRAARAVGQACGANPIPLLVPCHRVLASGSRLGGFSGGLDWKERILEREGCPLPGRSASPQRGKGRGNAQESLELPL